MSAHDPYDPALTYVDLGVPVKPAWKTAPSIPLPSPAPFLTLTPYLTQAARSKSFSIAVFIEVNDNTRLREKVDYQETEPSGQYLIWQDFRFNKIQGYKKRWHGSNRPSINSTARHGYSPASSQLVSEVITAVLSHHMSWVPTVAPSDQSLDNPQGAYDPLWAQLSDLYGNIGTSSRISRTIVVGSNGSFVRRMLYILSYFIRCNEVFQRVTEFKDDPESLLNLPVPIRNMNELAEENESGSPATMMRSISIPKRPRIDTFAARGLSVSRASVSSRLTSIGEPTTPTLLAHNDGDRPITPSVSRRPLFDTSRPRIDSKDSISSESTPCHSRPTTPTTIESRPDSDRVSAAGEENGFHSQNRISSLHGPSHQLRVDTMRSRTHSSDTLSTDAPRSAHDSGCPAQDILADVPLPPSRVVCSFPPFPNTVRPNGSGNGDVLEDKVLPADVLFCKSYGRSLMAPYCDRYMSDFALMGVPKFDFQHFMETDMRDTMRHFEIQERVTSTVCIVADANTMKCNVFCAKTPAALPQAILDTGGSGNGGGFGGGVGLDLRGEPVTRLPHTSTSAFLDSTLHQMVDLSRSGLAAELCLNYLEDRLHQLYQSSRMLSSMARDKDMLRSYPSLDSVAPLLGLHRSDMSLVAAICSTYDDLVGTTFDN
ncbi:Folliculin-interacting protein 1 [Linnemannia zychae]|nr:Folliculin-interacting protein 1 [Linnemannia zychae]